MKNQEPTSTTTRPRLQRRQRAWRVCAVALLTVLPTACTGGGLETPGDAERPNSEEPKVMIIGGDGPLAAAAQPTLGIRLSEGSPGTPSEAKPLPTTPLSADDTAAILARLGPWVNKPTGRTEPNLPIEGLPRPEAGETIASPFPAEAADVPKPTPTKRPVEVIRFQPEGDVPIAAHVTVVFNQPMVQLADLDSVNATPPEITISPEVDGRWKWLSTTTARFEASGKVDRLPAATEFTVTVPKSLRSVAGTRPATSTTWTFTTPPPSVRQVAGLSTSMSTTPVFTAVFDQLVDTDAVLESTSLTVDGTRVALVAASDNDLAHDDAHVAKAAADGAPNGYSVSFRPTAPLPSDAGVSLVFSRGLGSAEGPATMMSNDSYTGRTYGAFAVAEAGCGHTCRPGESWTIRLSNPIAMSTFTPTTVTIDPAIAGLSFSVHHDTITVHGNTTGTTEYSATLATSLTDVYGQSLAAGRTLNIAVGSAQPQFRPLSRQFLTVLPHDAAITLTSINHDELRVKAWAVSPTDVEGFRALLNEHHSREDAHTPPAPDWPVALDTTVTPDAPPNAWASTRVNLTSAFDAQSAQLVVWAGPATQVSGDAKWQNVPTLAWVQRSEVAIDAFVDQRNVLIWTTDLATGKPLGKVPVELVGDGRVATTDDDGLATIALGTQPITGLFATAGDATSFLPPEGWGGWVASPSADTVLWYSTTDRGLYQPGETLHVSGWVRRRTGDGDLQTPEPQPITYELADANGNQFATGTTTPNALGGFSISARIPKNVALGDGWLNVSTVGGGHGLNFTVQDVRRPEYEVTTAPTTPGPFVLSQPATVETNAKYFSGGALTEAPVRWQVSSSTTTFRPPNWDAYSFGEWIPWWFDHPVSGGYAAIDGPMLCGPGACEPRRVQTYTGTTDAAGSHRVQLDFDGAKVDLPALVSVESTVTDINRQTISDRTQLIVHPATAYVGLRATSTLAEVNAPTTFDMVVTDVDGQLAPGLRVDARFGRVTHTLNQGDSAEELVDVTECSVTSTASTTDESMRCTFTPTVAGRYRFVAVVTDAEGQTSRSQVDQWVTGDDPTQATVAAGDAVLVPSAPSYAAGDTATILVQAPFAQFNGIVHVVTDRIVSTVAFESTTRSAVVEIPITEAMYPKARAEVVLVSSTTLNDGEGPNTPLLARGQVPLNVPPLERTLHVSAGQPATAQPGADTQVTVAVSNPDGSPAVNTDVAVMVVDEAVLSLTDFNPANPVDSFFAERSTWLQSTLTRENVLTPQAVTDEGLDADDADLKTDHSGTETALEAPATSADRAVTESAKMNAGESATGGQATPITARSDFSALAAYLPGQTTGPDGTVTVPITLPDSLTRYRVIALAASPEQRFGLGESTLTAELPIQVRPSMPRFLNFGDTAELPVVVVNNSAADIDIDVVMEAANLQLDGATDGQVGKRIHLGAGGRTEVVFSGTTAQVGTAGYRIVATSGEFADAATGSLPVYTPATSEAFATYGVIDAPRGDGAAVRYDVAAPTGALSGVGGLDVSYAATALHGLSDAVIDLNVEEFASTDSIAHRVLGLSSVAPVLDKLAIPDLPKRSAIDAHINEQIAELVRRQRDDGMWGWLSPESTPVGWVTLGAARSLVEANAHGYVVPQAALDNAVSGLRKITTTLPDGTDPLSAARVESQALRVRQLAGAPDTARALAIYREFGSKLDLATQATLWPSITDAETRDEIRTRIMNAANDTAGGVSFVNAWTDNKHLTGTTSRIADATILDVLITEDAESDLIPKLARGLLDQASTTPFSLGSERAATISAVRRYADAFESVDPAFTATTWLGAAAIAQVDFAEPTTGRQTQRIPLSALGGDEGTHLTVGKVGLGRLYYRLGLNYAPAATALPARDEGFDVSRSYVALEDATDVSQDADGNWQVAAGALVQVVVTVTADSRRDHVVVTDPLPAGFESVNPDLSTAQTAPIEASNDKRSQPDQISRPAHPGLWFGHQEFRHDRTEAYAWSVDGGTYEYTYMARATTPGVFTALPAKAEQIYAPEVFGRSASATVTVKRR